MVEIKGDHYLDDEGNLFFPYTKRGNGEPMDETELLNRRLEWAGKNMCMKTYNVEVWTSKQCRPIITAVESYFGKDWIESFRVVGNKDDRVTARKINWVFTNGSPSLPIGDYILMRNMIGSSREMTTFHIRYNYGITPFELDSMKSVSSQDISKTFVINGKGVIPNFYTKH